MIWVPEDGAEIRGDVTLAPGVYWLPAGLTIAADNLTEITEEVIRLMNNEYKAGG